MPLYEFFCGQHGKFELLKKMSERHKLAPCAKCGKECKRVDAELPAIWTDEKFIGGKYLLSEDKTFYSRAELNQHLKDNNLRIVEKYDYPTSSKSRQEKMLSSKTNPEIKKARREAAIAAYKELNEKGFVYASESEQQKRDGGNAGIGEIVI